MNREIAILLVGAGIALVSTVVTAILTHFLSLRADKVRRERDREESIREQTRATLKDSSDEAINAVFGAQALKQERLRVLEETQRDAQERVRSVEEGNRASLEEIARIIEEGARFIGEGARFIKEGNRFIEEGDRASLEERARSEEEGTSEESPEVKD